MSAETVGAEMPTHVTLDDLSAMAAADENHRYELSAEGDCLSCRPRIQGASGGGVLSSWV